MSFQYVESLITNDNLVLVLLGLLVLCIFYYFIKKRKEKLKPCQKLARFGILLYLITDIFYYQATSIENTEAIQNAWWKGTAFFAFLFLCICARSLVYYYKSLFHPSQYPPYKEFTVLFLLFVLFTLKASGPFIKKYSQEPKQKTNTSINVEKIERGLYTNPLRQYIENYDENFDLIEDLNPIILKTKYINEVFSDKKTALTVALKNHFPIDGFKILLEKGANPDYGEPSALTILCTDELVSVELLKLFLSYQPKLNFDPKNDIEKDLQPIIVATKNYQLSFLEPLANAGAKLSAKDSKGRTPISILLETCYNCTPTVKKLLDLYPDGIHDVDNQGCNPLMILLNNGHAQPEVVQLLIERGVDVQKGCFLKSYGILDTPCKLLKKTSIEQSKYPDIYTKICGEKND